MIADAGLVRIQPQHVAAMTAHAEFCWPNEACGLVAVDPGGGVRMVYALTNLDASPFRFTVDPAEHYGAWRHASRMGWTIGGSFHSHPRSVAKPSRNDVAGALDPTWLYFIVGPVNEPPPEVRVYEIRGATAHELAMTVGR